MNHASERHNFWIGGVIEGLGQGGEALDDFLDDNAMFGVVLCRVN